jgi:hypothetical protein
MSVVPASAPSGTSTLNGASGGNAALSATGSGGAHKGKELTPEFLAELKKAFSKNIIKVRSRAAGCRQQQRAGWHAEPIHLNQMRRPLAAASTMLSRLIRACSGMHDLLVLKLLLRRTPFESPACSFNRS